MPQSILHTSAQKKDTFTLTEKYHKRIKSKRLIATAVKE